METVPLLTVRQLKVHYTMAGAWPWSGHSRVRAVEDINFNLYPGQTLGIVGESGCGKSTLARALIGLQPIASGAVVYEGQDLRRLAPEDWHPYRRSIQMVFQDPLASLDPRMTIGESIAEPLRSLCPEVSPEERDQRVIEMLGRVGLPAELRDRYPHEFSGGQCQRAGIARALIVRPKILICDEAVSALDVSVQAQVINLLMKIQREDGLSIIFIAHDLAVVRHISHRVLVMYLGRMMEQADCDELFSRPRHPYTKALLASIPGESTVEQRAQQLLEGEIPSATSPSHGCPFATRCPMADEQCGRRVPHVRSLGRRTSAACHYLAEVA